LPVRVVSVGNLVAGGTGKTPMVAAIARMLLDRGLRVGVVTGAYGARPDWAPDAEGRRFRCEIVRGPDLAAGTVERVGDETVLLAEALHDIPIAAGRPKARAAGWLAASADLDTILVDDGFQHHSLARDIDIVLLDARRPFGDGRVLPAGRLREGPESLRDADIVILTGAGEAGAAVGVEERVRALAPEALVVTARRVAVGARREPGSQPTPLAVLSRARVIAVCGLGSPESFARTLRELGADAEMMRYRDHHAYTEHDFRRIEDRASGRAIVTTAKDATKWRGRVDFPYIVVDVEMCVSDADPLLDRILGAAQDQGASDART
jgi:tetraacyldisaccharide 4'-kinase